MDAKAKDLESGCSCANSVTNDNRPFLTRLWRAIRAWENALDYTGTDYLLTRLSELEKEVSLLRAADRERRQP